MGFRDLFRRKSVPKEKLPQPKRWSDECAGMRMRYAVEVNDENDETKRFLLRVISDLEDRRYRFLNIYMTSLSRNNATRRSYSLDELQEEYKKQKKLFLNVNLIDRILIVQNGIRKLNGLTEYSKYEKLDEKNRLIKLDYEALIREYDSLVRKIDELAMNPRLEESDVTSFHTASKEEQKRKCFIKSNWIERILILENGIRIMKGIPEYLMQEEVEHKTELNKLDIEKVIEEYHRLEQEMNKLAGITMPNLSEGPTQVAQTLSTSPGIVGKNYVISDIHGRDNLYSKVKEHLNPGDTLWVLGDVIDKSSGGIAILQDIIANSKSNTGIEINLILGNHEYMMLEWIEAFKRLGIEGKEIIDYLRAKNWLNTNLYRLDDAEFRKNRGIETPEDIVLLEKKENADKVIEDFDNMLQEYKTKGFKKEVDAIEDAWAFSNGGQFTMWKFYQLPKESQQEIYDFLRERPLMVTRQFGNNKVVLVHSVPLDIEPKMDDDITLQTIQGLVNSEEEKEDLIDSMIWDCTEKQYSNARPVIDRYLSYVRKGWTTICRTYAN